MKYLLAVALFTFSALSSAEDGEDMSEMLGEKNCAPVYGKEGNYLSHKCEAPVPEKKNSAPTKGLKNKEAEAVNSPPTSE